MEKNVLQVIYMSNMIINEYKPTPDNKAPGRLLRDNNPKQNTGNCMTDVSGTIRGTAWLAPHPW